MRERWLNAVVEARLPLDLPLNASPAEREKAALEAMEAVLADNKDVVATVHLEEVIDGESVDEINRRRRSDSPYDRLVREVAEEIDRRWHRRFRAGVAR